ncbi:MAG TPA: alanine dehydrogenase [Gaiellaceae bacterium]|jgi:alanine dehydrogenase|nr:alanine dehydrogenase [Gaiellaceae bacterium]
MRIGVVKEIKPDEYRVALTPAGARELGQRGHEVLVEAGAGVGSRFPDTEYEAVGARLTTVDDVWATADMVLKVKEPLPDEFGRLRDGLVLFTYLHLAADDTLTRALLASGATCIAYETVETDDGRLPLLAPMSEVAGRLATQMGAWALEKAQGGRGLLLGGVPGVAPAKVVVLGGGIVGYNAALIAVGMQADVWVLDKSVERMRDLEMMLDGRITLAMSNRLQIDQAIRNADLVIGAVLVPGARAPKLVARDQLVDLRPGTVLVDVAIDQGGCFETSHPTTHSDPIYEVDGIVHYCVSNMPGAVPVTSTFALMNVTLPYVEAIADHGVRAAIARDPALARGVNVLDGNLTYEAVADAHGLDYVPLEQVLPLERV